MSKIKYKGNSFVKDAIILFAITLVAGLLLGFVYQLTKKPIENATVKAKQEAYGQVMADADSFTSDSQVNEKLTKAKLEGAEIEEIVLAKKGDEVMGYAISCVAKEGYGGDISLIMGVDLEGKITGLKVMDMSETAGLGANCKTDDYLNQFKNKQLPENGEITLKKNGEAQGDNELNAISGATITSKAITKATNQILKFVASLN